MNCGRLGPLWHAWTIQPGQDAPGPDTLCDCGQMTQRKQNAIAEAIHRALADGDAEPEIAPDWLVEHDGYE